MMRRIVPLFVCLLAVLGTVHHAAAALVKVAAVAVSPSSVVVNVGKTQLLTATAKDSAGKIINGVTFTWSSDAHSIAVVNTNGLITAVAHGTARIKATASDGVSGSATITVQNPAVASITVSPGTAQIVIGKTQNFTAVAKDANGDIVSGVNLTWSSDATQTATVTASGVASATSAGTARITATAPDGVTGTGVLTVQAPAVVSVSVSPVSSQLVPGQAQQFSATAKDGSGNIINGISFAWSSKSVSVAAVSASGLASAVNQGTTQITATAPDGISGSGMITVQPPVVASLNVSIPSTPLVVGQTEQLTALAQDANGHPISGVNFNWSSKVTSVATVSTSGLAAGVNHGMAQITATAPNGVTGSASLIVETVTTALIPANFFGMNQVHLSVKRVLGAISALRHTRLRMRRLAPSAAGTRATANGHSSNPLRALSIGAESIRSSRQPLPQAWMMLNSILRVFRNGRRPTHPIHCANRLELAIRRPT